MNRRHLLNILGFGTGSAVLGSAAWNGSTTAAPWLDRHEGDSARDACLESCVACAVACDEAAHHCLTKLAEGDSQHADRHRATTDCAEFCRLAAQMMARQSPYMIQSCQACGEVCQKTAEIIKDGDAPVMVEARKQMEQCVQTCREMVLAMKDQGQG